MNRRGFFRSVAAGAAGFVAAKTAKSAEKPKKPPNTAAVIVHGDLVVQGEIYKEPPGCQDCIYNDEEDVCEFLQETNMGETTAVFATVTGNCGGPYLEQNPFHRGQKVPGLIIWSNNHTGHSFPIAGELFDSGGRQGPSR